MADEQVLLYETTVDDKADDKFEANIEVNITAQESRVLHEDDDDGAEKSNAALLQLVGKCRYKVFDSRPWKCSECHFRPATQIIGSTVRLERPGGYNRAKIVDDRIHPVCSESSCVTTASNGVRKAQKKAETKFAGDSTVNFVHVCNTCGREEGNGPALLRCTRCKVALYCSVSCQKKHWKEHKKYCGKVKYEKWCWRHFCVSIKRCWKNHPWHVEHQ